METYLLILTLITAAENTAVTNVEFNSKLTCLQARVDILEYWQDHQFTVSAVCVKK